MNRQDSSVKRVKNDAKLQIEEASDKRDNTHAHTYLDHAPQRALELLAIVLRQLGKLALLNLDGERELIGGAKWRHKRRHLIDQAAKAPNIRLFIVLALLDWSIRANKIL